MKRIDELLEELRDEIRQSRIEFTQTRFTADDGIRMKLWVDSIVAENDLRDPEKNDGILPASNE